MKIIAGVSFAVMLSGMTAWSQTELSGGVMEAASWTIPRVDGHVHIDGALDDEAWTRALVIEADLETRPAENEPAPVKTECMLLYQDDALLVAFRAHDPDPASIRAHLTDRDRAFDDDFVGVVLDTFHDARRAFEFFVNPLGVQMDLFQDDVAGSESESWDALWESAGRLTPGGYEVEMKIPFTSLRFPRTDGVQTWGIDVVRIHPRDQRRQYRNHPMDRNRNCYLCQLPSVTGLEGIRPGRNLEIDPTLTGTTSASRAGFTTGELEGQGVDADAGATLGWGMTPNLNLGVAANPDFSQVEADSAQLGVNTRFALFFPEKRPFFLEGGDFFSTPLNVVFTRNVADPLWGVKLTGKEGSDAIGVFVAQDDVTNILLPGPEGSDAASLDIESTDAAVRYRRDVGASSTLGALVTFRKGDGYENGVAGVDGQLRLGASDRFLFQLLGSETRYPGELAAELGQSRDRLTDYALRGSYNHETRDWNAYAIYQDLGPDFRADLGFLPQVGYRQAFAGGGRTWIGGGEDWYTQLNVGAEYDQSEERDGALLSREWEAWINLNGPRQSFFNLDVGIGDRSFERTTYRGQRFLNLNAEATPVGPLTVGGFLRAADTIDYDNGREGTVRHLESWANLRIGRRTRVDLSQLYEDLDVAGGRLYRANVTDLRAYYQFNLRTFVRAIMQLYDIERAPSLYVDDVEARERSIGSQVLFSYKLNPRTVFFVGYSDDRFADTTAGLTQTGWTVFVKLGYAWVL